MLQHQQRRHRHQSCNDEVLQRLRINHDGLHSSPLRSN